MVGESAVPPPATGFEIVRKGYDQAQVEVHLRRLDAEIRILATDRDAATDQASQLARELDEARDRTERLRAQVRSLVSPPQSVQGMSERMRSMLRLAEDEVSEMLAQAEADSEQRLRDADQQAAQILDVARAETATVHANGNAAAERREREIAQAVAELEAQRRTAADEIAAAAADAEREREKVWAESSERLALVEEDFLLAMDQRRSEALRDLTAGRLEARRASEELRERAAAAARETIDDAKAQAQSIVADAHSRVTELTAVRCRVVDQLGGTRAVLERTLIDLEPLPGDYLPADYQPADYQPTRHQPTETAAGAGSAVPHNVGTTDNGAAAAPTAASAPDQPTTPDQPIVPAPSAAPASTVQPAVTTGPPSPQPRRQPSAAGVGRR